MRWIALLFSFAAYIIAPPAYSQQKLALVVGNSNYGNGWNALPNSRRDAQLIADSLKNIGFTLLGNGPLFDLDRKSLGDRISELSAKAKKGDMPCFTTPVMGYQSLVRTSLFLQMSAVRYLKTLGLIRSA
jgi:hypothetical protein